MTTKKKANLAVQKSRKLVNSTKLREKHRTEKKYFSRSRILTFPVMLSLLIQKSAKSMQIVLNEFFEKLDREAASSSAFTQARSHLSHKVFIELNQEAIIDVCYGDGEYERYKGYRLCGVDGSKIYLPKEEKIIAEFGGSAANQYSTDITPYALGSVLYDLLNHVAIDSLLAPADAYEVELAIEHLAHTTEKDLLLFDRNYPSYRFLSTLMKENRAFVIRCSAGSFSAVRRMFKGNGPDSQIVTLSVPSSQSKEINKLDLPRQITVRLVRVMLDTGEMEVLITSLVDDIEHPTADFKALYFLRWGSETFYDLLKNRLQIEHFTGKTVESVKQDFYAAIYISGLETLLTGKAQSILQKRSEENKYPLQINHAISFNSIKNHVFALLLDSESDEQLLLDKLTRLFLQKPTPIRKERSFPRKKPTPSQGLQFHKRVKKICF